MKKLKRNSKKLTQISFLFLSLSFLVNCSKFESQSEKPKFNIIAESDIEDIEIDEVIDLTGDQGGQPGKLKLLGLGLQEQQIENRLDSRVQAKAIAGKVMVTELEADVLPENEVEFILSEVTPLISDFNQKTYVNLGCIDQIDPAETLDFKEIQATQVGHLITIKAEKVFICGQVESKDLFIQSIVANKLFLNAAHINWFDKNADVSITTNSLDLVGLNKMLMYEADDENNFVALSKQKLKLQVIDRKGLTGLGQLTLIIQGATLY